MLGVLNLPPGALCAGMGTEFVEGPWEEREMGGGWPWRVPGR